MLAMDSFSATASALVVDSKQFLGFEFSIELSFWCCHWYVLVQHQNIFLIRFNLGWLGIYDEVLSIPLTEVANTSTVATVTGDPFLKFRVPV